MRTQDACPFGKKRKSAFRKANMALNNGKQQVLGLTKQVREAWRQHSEATQAAQDLGVHTYGHKDKHPETRAGCKVEQASVHEPAHQCYWRNPTASWNDDGFVLVRQMLIRFGMSLRHKEADPRDAQGHVHSHGR